MLLFKMFLFYSASLPTRNWPGACAGSALSFCKLFVFYHSRIAQYWIRSVNFFFPLEFLLDLIVLDFSHINNTITMVLLKMAAVSTHAVHEKVAITSPFKLLSRLLIE